jgi:hypothetical protein
MPWIRLTLFFLSAELNTSFLEEGLAGVWHGRDFGESIPARRFLLEKDIVLGSGLQWILPDALRLGSKVTVPAEREMRCRRS